MTEQTGNIEQDRAEFEKAWRERPIYMGGVHQKEVAYIWWMQAARRAQVVPQGWRLVPEKHTLDMSIAFAESFYSKVRCIDDDDISDWYSELLAAAPQPPEAGSHLTFQTQGGAAPVQLPEPQAEIEVRSMKRVQP